MRKAINNIYLALILGASVLSAQPDNLPRTMLPPELFPEPRLSPQERQTINRALTDLKSDNAEIRAGAVMLLGKYHAREAKRAVVSALNDSSARVRRAALVSIAEWRHGLSVESVEPILAHIADEDVEVRRQVSSMIPQMMNIWRTARMVRPSFGQRDLKPEIQEALIGAYQDEDAVVRHNVLIAHNSINLPTPPEIFIDLLDDPDRKVRLEAIPLAIGYAPPSQWQAPAEAIIEGDDRIAQLRLTAELGRRGSLEGIELLRQLAGSDNPEIAAEASLAIFRWTGDPNQLEWLVNALVNDQLTQDQGQRLLQLMRGYRELAAPIAPELTELKSSVLRQEAVRLFLSLDLAEQYPEILERLFSDSNQDIRAMALSQLYSRPDLVNQDRIDSLLDNPYPDVRASLVQLAVRQPRQQASDLLFDLMLDESVDVRVAALETISAIRMPGWSDIVANSLEDPDLAMQRAAVVILLHDKKFPRREQLLQEYVDNNPKSPLTPRIRTEISKGELIEIDMNL